MYRIPVRELWWLVAGGAGYGARYRPVDIQQRFVFPSTATGRGGSAATRPKVTVTVTMPAAPRLRRTTRPFGTISLFLAATGILGLTSLCYLWQAGQATAAAMHIQTLRCRASCILRYRI